MKRPMTPRCFVALREELQKLKALRPELAKAIEVARGHGDLSENADYDAAREKSGLTEAKIRDIETKIANAQVIDPRTVKEPDRVVFGVSVKLEEIESGEVKNFSIYGADESNIERGWISIETPIARALIGKSIGDVAKVTLPGGSKEYEVLEIFVDYRE